MLHMRTRDSDIIRISGAHKLTLEPGAPSCFLSCGEDGAVRTQATDAKVERKVETWTSLEYLGRTSWRWSLAADLLAELAARTVR